MQFDCLGIDFQAIKKWLFLRVKSWLHWLVFPWLPSLLVSSHCLMNFSSWLWDGQLSQSWYSGKSASRSHLNNIDRKSRELCILKLQLSFTKFWFLLIIPPSWWFSVWHSHQGPCWARGVFWAVCPGTGGIQV